MKSFTDFLNEKMFDDYEAIASKYTRLFKQYGLRKIKSFKVPNVGSATVFEMNIDCENTKYKITIRREPSLFKKYKYVYLIQSMIDLNSKENFINKKYYIPETINNYVNFETLLKTITITNKCDTIKSAIKKFITLYSIES